MKRNLLLAAMAVLLFNCSDEVQKDLTPTTEYYFMGNVDGVQVLVEEKDDIEFISGYSSFGVSGQGCSASYKSGLYEVYESGITLTPLLITFNNVANAPPPCNEETLDDIFFSEFTPGNYPFTILDYGGVMLHYYEGTVNSTWRSWFTNRHKESFFTVEKTEFIGVDESGRKIQKVEGKFSCYLYKFDFDIKTPTDSIFISDAKFVYKFLSE